MSSSSFTIKQNDTLPVLGRRFIDDTGTVIDLSAASTVTFRMRRWGSTTLKIEAPAIIVDPLPVVNTDDQVEYRWITGDTDITGNYEAEFEITFANGKILTVPNDGSMLVSVISEIG